MTAGVISPFVFNARCKLARGKMPHVRVPDCEYGRLLSATCLPEGLTSALFPEGIALDGHGWSADRYATFDAHRVRRAAPRIRGPGIVRPPGGNAARLHEGRGPS